MTMTLLFDETASETNNNFHSGLNVTVRRGLKYLALLKPGDDVVMANLQGELLGEATVHQMLAGKMVDIPSGFLELEHDPKSRNLQGLVEVMQNCYADSELDENEVTVAIVLKITG